MGWTLGPHPDDPPARPAEPAEVVPHRIDLRSISSHVVIRPRTDTRSIVVVELLPILPPMIVAALASFSPGLVSEAWAATAIVATVFARLDRTALRRRGFLGVPTAFAALVHPILYLVLRSRACRAIDPEASAPLPWAIGATVVGGIGVLIDWIFYGGITQGIASVVG